MTQSSLRERDRPWSSSQWTQIEEYLVSHNVPLNRITRADLVLVLLRINTPEALVEAERIVGKPIAKCPSAMPPWPPKPISEPRARQAKIIRVDFPPGQHQVVRIGMTREQLLARGVTRQNLFKWTRTGRVKWSKP